MRATQPRIRFSRVRSLSFSTALELQLPRCSTALSGSRLGLHRLGGSIASYVPLSGPEGFFFFFPLTSQFSGASWELRFLILNLSPDSHGCYF